MPDDNSVLILQEKIKKQKELVGPSVPFTPKTNLVITIFNSKVNLHTQSIPMLAILSNMLVHALVLIENIEGADTKLDGYDINDWVSDINTMIARKVRDMKLAKLSLLESRLESLLSKEYKDSIILKEIEEELSK